MSIANCQYFEARILDWSRAKPKRSTFVPPGESSLVMNDQYGLSYVPTANKLRGKVDIVTGIPIRVLFLRAKDHKRAKRIAQRIGTLLSLRKVDASYKIKKVEYIELNQKPMMVEVNLEDQFVLNAKGELTPAQQSTKGMLEQKYNLPIDLT
jgi:hypothetical protein